MQQLHAFNRISIIVFLLFFYTNSHAQSNYALSFDGTDDYVSTSTHVVPTSGDFTVECWVYATTYSGYREFVSQGASGSAFYIGTTTGTGEIRCGDAWTATGVTMPLNQWVHIALVKSGGSATLYLDGMQKANLPSSYSAGSGGANFHIGVQYGGTGEFFNGMMDELRVWNTARTPADIKANMFNKNLDNAATGLVAYYRFNEGSGTNAGNACTNTTGIDGTVTNGAAWNASPIQFGGNALSFDGVDDYVISASTFNLNMSGSSFTVETWVNSANATANTTTERILLQWGPTWGGGQPGTYRLVCTNAKFNFNFSGSSTGSCTYPVNWQDGNWHHIAGVFDISAHMLYLYYDGVQRASSSTAGHEPTGLNSSLYIGGSPSIANSFASVKMDEVRVWNVARSATDIQANMSKELDHPFSNIGTVPRLYYTFNQGTADGANSGLVTVIEQYLEAPGNGTLVNFSFSGNSNFVTQNSGVEILPLTWLSFTAQPKNEDVLLQWSTASEKNVSNFVIEHSTNETDWETIGSLPAAGNPGETHLYSYRHTAAANGMNFYRIRQNDENGRYSYSAIRTVRMYNEPGTFKVIGNPAVNKTLQLQVNAATKQTIKLFSSNGRLIWTKQFSPGTYKVDLHQRSHGVYILSSGNHTEKFVLQ